MWYSCKANSDPLCLEDYPKKEKEKKERERERERVEQAAPTLQNQMVCLLIKKLHPKRTFIIKVMLTDTLRVKVNKMKYLILFFFFFYKIEFLL